MLMQHFQPGFLQHYPDSVVLFLCSPTNLLQFHIFRALFFPNIVIFEVQELSFIKIVYVPSKFSLQTTSRQVMSFVQLKSRHTIHVVYKFEYAEVTRILQRVQLLLCIEGLQPLIVCADVHLNAYQLVPLLPEVVHNREQFFIIDWPVALFGREGFWMVLKWGKMFSSVDDMVLRQDTSNCLRTSISFYDCAQCFIDLGEVGS